MPSIAQPFNTFFSRKGLHIRNQGWRNHIFQVSWKYHEDHEYVLYVHPTSPKEFQYQRLSKQLHFQGLVNVCKCPNWTSPNYLGCNLSNLQQIFEGDVQNPTKGTFTDPWFLREEYASTWQHKHASPLWFCNSLRMAGTCSPSSHCLQFLQHHELT